MRERKRADSRARVVDVALELFAARGYDGVTVNDICEAADIAPRTFFRYFPVKEDVLAQPVREMTDRLTAALAAIPLDRSDAECVSLALMQVGEYVVADQERFRYFFQVAAQPSATKAHPFLRLAAQDSDLVAHLARRRPAAPPPDWRTRLLVARTTASFRVWLDDLVRGTEPDPIAHLREVLDAP